MPARQGLAERAVQARDRRTLRIAATPKGRKLLLAGRDRRVRALAKHLASLTQDELSVLHQAAQLLARI